MQGLKPGALKLWVNRVQLAPPHQRAQEHDVPGAEEPLPAHDQLFTRGFVGLGEREDERHGDEPPEGSVPTCPKMKRFSRR